MREPAAPLDRRRARARVTLALWCAVAAPGLARAADDTPPAPPAEAGPQRFAVHAQGTFTVQATPGFPSPYVGAQSLTPHQAKETADVTVYAGVRPWRGAELWVNPEIDQGFGLSNTLGVAGFPSAEAYKVGSRAPYFKLPRLFLRQTIDLGGDAAPVAAGANQLAGAQTANRLVITLGKFGVVDVFDTNRYGHDPRTDFLNWAAIDAGAFDYAANAWGYTFGGAVEWYHAAWTVRSGLFNLSKQPNQPSLETGFQQYQLVGEVEHRQSLHGHPGAIRLGGYYTHGNLALLRDLIAAHDRTGVMPDNASLRHMNGHGGGYLSIDQELSATVGVFVRASAGDGVTEADDFTDIDRSVSIGAQIAGSAWRRTTDKVGVVALANGISRTRQIFLNLGGLGTLVGDGRLPHPGHEWIGEGWYQLGVLSGVTLTADYQVIANPAYNRDRGPVHVFGFRLHAAV
ncbi:carbohydrate porin [Novosphingobium sp.]|uniref:carbohydrate porin n=1 Tax=Novosphingobium sp. TaxID=1874826 RepID=UPI00333FB0BD